MALDSCDLALEAGEGTGRETVGAFLDLDILQERYATGFRWQLGVREREDLTLEFWMKMIQEE
jgi:hypothetical protein